MAFYQRTAMECHAADPSFFEGAGWTFFVSFFHALSNASLETLWASKNEYSGELGAQKGSKMEPKIEEKSHFAKK